MADRVTCVIKGDSSKYSDCRCITQLGTANKRYTRTEAHDKVKASPGSLYVERGGSRANVVAATRNGLKYVRTAPNDSTSDNLLSLPSC